MKQRPRIYYSETQKALMRDRWRKGDTIHEIARLFDRGHSSVQRILSDAGGIRPAQRHRAARALTFAEREEISRSLALGLSIRAIASRLNRAPSTISRELKRNGGRQSYRASQADALAWERARRPKLCKLVRNRVLARVVAGKLRLQWSPEQIAGWLKHVYAVNKDYQVSHEAIYRSLYIQARGG
ncbi:Helix-turn-helix domain-containing protein [Cupriavidus sp. YR651]|nr:Helix-turn-helix domain-containing protein [Cupriavidus sp. YR651]